MPALLVDIIKFIHILLTLSIIGSVFYCLALCLKKKNDARDKAITRINKMLLVLAFFAIITGTALIYPKNFTFQTPWIQAAYVLATTFVIAIVLLLFLRKK